jgi:hypothetical protein
MATLRLETSHLQQTKLSETAEKLLKALATWLSNVYLRNEKPTVAKKNLGTLTLNISKHVQTSISSIIVYEIV